MAQVVEPLPSKCEALSSYPSSAKKEKKCLKCGRELYWHGQVFVGLIPQHQKNFFLRWSYGKRFFSCVGEM
jgi:hypothetical protein